MSDQSIPLSHRLIQLPFELIGLMPKIPEALLLAGMARLIFLRGLKAAMQESGKKASSKAQLFSNASEKPKNSRAQGSTSVYRNGR